MTVFFLLLIPVSFVLIGTFVFHIKFKWYNVASLFAATVLVSVLIFFAASNFQIYRREYWTGWLTKVSHFEAWNELVRYLETVPSGVDSKGNTTYTTVMKTRVDYHPEYFVAYGSNREEYSISKDLYEHYKRLWGNSSFQEMNRKFYTIDGNRYNSVFSLPVNGYDRMQVISSEHKYKNKVAVSKSIFKLRDVSKDEIEKFNLYEYPRVKNLWDLPSILSKTDIPGLGRANKNLSNLNAQFGASKQIRVWLLIFKDQPLDAGYLQQNHWLNGNMNELVLCVGVNKENRVTWGHSFSWCDDNRINVESRNIINDQISSVLNLDKIINWLWNKVPELWKRKDFKKDFEYIQTEDSFWAIILAVIFTIGANVGICYFVMNNEYNFRY